MNSKAALLCLAIAANGRAAESQDCAECHGEIARMFAATAHANASRSADARSILGSFEDSKNVLFTRADGVYFRMERRGERFVQTGFANGQSRTEPFDFVIGSGRRGQSYLYWRGGLLHQLPVSYHVGSKRWVNSPGYPDGSVIFDRVIPPQCLACHTTRFRLEWKGAAMRYGNDYLLGVTCRRCHGDTEDHSRIRRVASIELCAQCHSGPPGVSEPRPDVHGNQVGLLRQSRCFSAGTGMTCVTCHNVHRVERDEVAMAERCGACHRPGQCSQASRGNCVECHMPRQRSKKISIQDYRTHRIAIYREK